MRLTFSRNQIRKANGKIAYLHYQLTDSTGRALRSLAGLFPATRQSQHLMARWLQLPDQSLVKPVETKISYGNYLKTIGSQNISPIKTTIEEDPVAKCNDFAWCLELDETVVTGEASDNEPPANEDDNQGDDGGDDSIWPPANDDGGYPSDDHHSGGNSDGTPRPEECTSSIAIGPLPTLLDPSQDPKDGGDDSDGSGSSNSPSCGGDGQRGGDNTVEKLDNDFITQPIDTTGWVCDGSYTGTANERETKKAWCASSVPTDGRLKKTTDALDKMEQRDEKCRQIAEKGKELLQQHGLRYYPDGTVPNGGWGGQSFGVLLSDRWLTYINNSGTVFEADSTKVKINLQFALTHEIEHAMGRSHIEGSRWRTPHAVQCSGF